MAAGAAAGGDTPWEGVPTFGDCPVRFLPGMSYAPPPGVARCPFAHTADVWLPSTHLVSGCVPVVVHVHGGGWLRGDKHKRAGGGQQLGRSLAARGVAVVCINYRLAPPPLSVLVLRAVVAALLVALACAVMGPAAAADWCPAGLSGYATVSAAAFMFFVLVSRVCNRRRYAPWPAPLQDLAAAVRWAQNSLRAHCPEADPVGRLFLSGAGSGAQVALIAAMRGDCPAQGVVGVCGIYDLRHPCGRSQAADSAVRRGLWAMGDALWTCVLGVGIFGGGKGLDEASPQGRLERAAPEAPLPPLLLLSSGRGCGGRRAGDALASEWQRRGGDAEHRCGGGINDWALLYHFAAEAESGGSADAVAGWLHDRARRAAAPGGVPVAAPVDSACIRSGSGACSAPEL